MRRVYLSLAVTVAVLFCVSGAFAEDKFSDSLSKARKLVEQKDYIAALEVYSGISGGLRKDPGLLIEWARVYTYADKHEEAIKLFEEVRAEHPERAPEIIRELADQYRWSGDAKTAEALYEDGLKIRPLDLELLLSKADALSFQDKLEESYALYQKVLDKEPGNLTALNNQARILVWQGYHRKGLVRYEEILKKYPKNPDAIEGIAFAYHWLGQDAFAVERIRELLEFEPGRKEAQDLEYHIKNSQGYFVRPYGRFSSDSTPQSVLTQGLRSGMHANYSTTIDAIYEHQVLRKKEAASTDEAYPLNGSNTSINADRWGLGFGKEFGNTFEFHAFMYESHFNKVDFTPYTADAWFTYKPDDCWRFDLAYDRETFEDNDALAYKVITNSPSLSVDFRPNRSWFFNAKYKRGFYTDDNSQNQFFGTMEYRLTQKPYVKLYYNHYYSSWGEPQLNHGYFNPRSLRSDMLGIYSGVDITKKLFLEGKASGGYEFQDKPDVSNKKSNHPILFAAASLNYRLSENWLVSASGDFFTTWPDNGQRSYQKRGAYLSFTYNFGAEPGTLQDATRPSRVTGSR